MKIENEIMAILNELTGAEAGELEPALDLFETGLLDSFGVVSLFVEIEERLGVSVAAETILRDEISTPEKIVRRVKRAAEC
ncbi:MAG: D-alanine--poly(phosphoribitol) ligase subunit 2 [Oscillospiraceae bacterium]|jgi:D-alanine--poly(phosphoribitol) ligase subunit 2|nr:D-alanine--poly(phosphoribitol) ligase subunit 2 [Oscillospiraceae bacterium]